MQVLKVTCIGSDWSCQVDLRLYQSAILGELCLRVGVWRVGRCYAIVHFLLPCTSRNFIQPCIRARIAAEFAVNRRSLRQPV
jgi:hypothetical protein